ncbi:MAG: hypothetical protein ACAH24_14540 [Hyphomicrobiaceae bacterium]
MITQLDRRPDGTFVPMLTLKSELEDIASAVGFKVYQDSDDLGPMRCAYLKTGRGNAFMLFAYAFRSTPKGYCDLAIPAGLKKPNLAIDDILRELRFDKRDTLPRDVKYKEIA